MNFREWVAYGVEKRWVSFPICDTHEGVPGTPEEMYEWEMGGDPCIVVMRIWGEEIEDDL